MSDLEKNKDQLLAEIRGLRKQLNRLAQVEHDFQESEENFYAFALASPVGIGRADANGRCLYVNPSWTKLTGLSVKESFGFGWKKLLHPEDIGGVLADFKRMREDGTPFSAEMRLIVNNKTLWGLAQVVERVGDDGKLAGYIATFTDITECKQVEAALKKSEEKYHDLYDNAPDMFASVDTKTKKIVECNQTLVKMLGYSKDELMSMNVLDLYHQDCIETVKRTIGAFMVKGVVRDAELILRKKDGSKLNVELNVSSIFNEQGNAILNRSIWRDISKRKAAEQKLFEKEAVWSCLIESEQTHVFVLNLEGKLLYTNHLRPDCSMDDVLGKSILNYIPLEKHEAFRRTLSSVLLSRKSQNIDFVSKKTAGDEFDCSMCVAPLQVGGEVKRFFVISSDLILHREDYDLEQAAVEHEAENAAEITVDPV